jgi:hypothetical protein
LTLLAFSARKRASGGVKEKLFFMKGNMFSHV